MVFMFLKDENWMFNKISQCYLKKPQIFTIWSFMGGGVLEYCAWASSLYELNLTILNHV